MSIKKTVLSTVVLASLLAANVAMAATAAAPATAPAPAAMAPAKPMMSDEEIADMRSTKMAKRMQEELKLTDDQMTKVKGVFNDMIVKAEKARHTMEEDTSSKLKGILTDAQYADWQKHRQERMEKRMKKHDKMMKKHEDEMM